MTDEQRETRREICERHATVCLEHMTTLLLDGYTMRAAQEIEQLERTEMLLNALVQAGVATKDEEERVEFIHARIRAALIEHEPRGGVGSIDPTPWRPTRARSGCLVDPPAHYDA